MAGLGLPVVTAEVVVGRLLLLLMRIRSIRRGRRMRGRRCWSLIVSRREHLVVWKMPGINRGLCQERRGRWRCGLRNKCTRLRQIERASMIWRIGWQVDRRILVELGAARVVVVFCRPAPVIRASDPVVGATLPARVIRPSSIYVVRVFVVEVVLQLFGLVEVKLLFGLVTKERTLAGRDHDRVREAQLTICMEFHSLLRILLISPVRIIWFAADT